jgi:ribosomal protein S18 acetylase RimI-like enzyme
MAVIRRATPADSPAGAELILMAASLAAEHLFDSELQRAMSVVQYLFARPSNLLSFDRAWVAGEGDEVAALLHGFPGYDECSLALSSLRFLPSILRIVGMCRMLRLAWRARQFLLSLCFRGERHYFLVNALAVYERFRRRGIATLLLEVAEQEARRLVLPRLRLVVRADNAPAIAAYQKFGFLVLDEVAYCLCPRTGGRIVWMRMEKILT